MAGGAGQEPVPQLYDLANTEVKDQQFLYAEAGVPVQHAYEVIHMEGDQGGRGPDTGPRPPRSRWWLASAPRERGPRENGTSAQSAFKVKDDPSKRWSKKDRAEVARRVARGETINL